VIKRGGGRLGYQTCYFNPLRSPGKPPLWWTSFITKTRGFLTNVTVVEFPVVTQDLMILCWVLHNYKSCTNKDNSNSGDVDSMDVSYDRELNLSANHELSSFKEATSHNEWKETMQKEYDALIKNGTWKLVDPPFGTKSIDCKRVFKNKYISYGSLDKAQRKAHGKRIFTKRMC